MRPEPIPRLRRHQRTHHIRVPQAMSITERSRVETSTQDQEHREHRTKQIAEIRWPRVMRQRRLRQRHKALPCFAHLRERLELRIVAVTLSGALRPRYSALEVRERGSQISRHHRDIGGARWIDVLSHRSLLG
ncbi:hypothetical protein ACFPRL_31790 [Pseudoclavibacter helvolus]